MADNLCGPSNPTKGLVGHLDRNRTAQQDRIVNSSLAPSGASFRSGAHSQASSYAANDAAFAAFTSGSPHLRGQMMPTATAHQAAQPIYPAAPVASSSRAAPTTANTSWVADFQRMRLSNGDGQAPVIGNASPYNHAIHNIRQVHRGNPVPSSSAQAAVLEQAEHRPFTVPQPGLTHMSKEQMFLGLAPEGAVVASPRQSKHYPREIALAASTEQALEAAFAAYDDDFQNEMDQWMDHHPPAGREDARREAFMHEFEWHQNWKRFDRGLDFAPQTDPRAQRKLEIKRDYELQKAALATLSALGDRMEQTPELREKVRNSSFVDLMRRLVNGEVVVTGQDLFDTVTGEIIDATKQSDAGTAAGMGPQGIHGSEDKTNSKDKGKGKEKAEGFDTA